jgi:hypothetical protein
MREIYISGKNHKKVCLNFFLTSAFTPDNLKIPADCHLICHGQKESKRRTHPLFFAQRKTKQGHGLKNTRRMLIHGSNNKPSLYNFQAEKHPKKNFRKNIKMPGLSKLDKASPNLYIMSAALLSGTGITGS